MDGKAEDVEIEPFRGGKVLHEQGDRADGACPGAHAEAVRGVGGRPAVVATSGPGVGVCCVGRWDRSPMTGYVARLVLEAGRECGERDPHSIMDGHIGGVFVVAAA
jgi:hypothetical protein